MTEVLPSRTLESNGSPDVQSPRSSLTRLFDEYCQQQEKANLPVVATRKTSPDGGEGVASIVQDLLGAARRAESGKRSSESSGHFTAEIPATGTKQDSLPNLKIDSVETSPAPKESKDREPVRLDADMERRFDNVERAIQEMEKNNPGPLADKERKEFEKLKTDYRKFEFTLVALRVGTENFVELRTWDDPDLKPLADDVLTARAVLRALDRNKKQMPKEAQDVCMDLYRYIIENGKYYSRETDNFPLSRHVGYEKGMSALDMARRLELMGKR